MLNKKSFLLPALLTGIVFSAIITITSCNNSGESTEAKPAETIKENKPPDTASTRPVIPPTKPATQ